VEAVVLETDGSFSVVRRDDGGPSTSLVGVGSAAMPNGAVGAAWADEDS
jgi:hypothetical protein